MQQPIKIHVGLRNAQHRENLTTAASVSFAVTRASSWTVVLFILVYNIISGSHRKFGILQHGSQAGIPWINKLLGGQLGFVPYPIACRQLPYIYTSTWR